VDHPTDITDAMGSKVDLWLFNHHLTLPGNAPTRKLLHRTTDCNAFLRIMRRAFAFATPRPAASWLNPPSLSLEIGIAWATMRCFFVFVAVAQFQAYSAI
jgi:hypothetical protein